MKKLNWAIWLGLLLSLFAFFSYPFIFARFAVTRDFPWANLLLFVLALGLTLVGLRRAFAPDRVHRKRSRAAGVTGGALNVIIFALFIFSVFVMSRWLPASLGAPRVGQKAPEFTLTDTSGKSVALGDLLTSPVNGKTPNGVLLIFYRGYW